MWRALGLVACSVLTFSLAGCLSGDDGPDPSDQRVDEVAPAANATILPEDILEAITISPGFDVPAPEGEEEFCWMPTNSCVRIPFVVENGGVRMEATLTWSTDANNIGLFIYHGEETITYDSGARPTGTSAELDHTFADAGEYALVVDPHWATPDTAELEATFHVA